MHVDMISIGDHHPKVAQAKLVRVPLSEVTMHGKCENTMVPVMVRNQTRKTTEQILYRAMAPL